MPRKKNPQGKKATPASSQDSPEKEEDISDEFVEEEEAEEDENDDSEEEELTLQKTAFSQKDKVRDPTQIYLGEIGFSPLLTAEEEVYFTRLAQKGDKKARARMIESNLRLVVKI